ncbi:MULTISPECIES: helix-turn-helix domain-containing protein [unclassified Nonomuraea]|uniref:helix-turn-helix domain-containing protein n=1 Tax=Nonomuraea sp. KC401 TaxID=1848324 RepID=UPI00191C62EC|nr:MULTISPECIES: helix-turn-helix domain-containing protein [unclassified Nonomuraea]
MDFEIREDRERSRGRRALSRERAAYLRLVQQGLSNKEACRIVGINLRTGRRWRNGRNPTGKHVGALPITSAAPPDVRGRCWRQARRRPSPRCWMSSPRATAAKPSDSWPASSRFACMTGW